MILLPFQWLKDKKSKDGDALPFFHKWLWMVGLICTMIILWGSFSNIWIVPWWENFIYLFFAAVFGLVLTTFLYVTVDRYVEKMETRGA
ncbi:hypothetical protein M8998_02265 [Sphingobacterium sp. lm-10]|uniref:hypothetical protein n=1 Tax=Sphingobacterium sp. lm-10 TaxID=2944904 RepID=UPI0020215CA6|nr:hypothetical protein [Sphingobacterium sp. lm-10]MCL7986757.1 hypothetical protein [Sphingobacterium sp. lm-10]